MALPAGADPVLWLKGTLVLGAAVPLSLHVLVRQAWAPLTPPSGFYVTGCILK